MHRFAHWSLWWLVAPAMLIALAAVPGHAQTYRTAIGMMGGWSTSGDLTPGLGQETVLEDSWLAGAQLETWPGTGRIGLRLNATMAERGLEGGQHTFTVAAADMGLILRLLAPARPRAVAPFVAVGAGGVLYGADEHEPALGGGAYGDDPVIRFMLTPSAGVDLLTGSPVGIRLEIADQIVFPGIGISPPSDGVPRVHNLAARAGIQFRFGQTLSRPVVATAPAARPERPAGEALYTVQIGGFAGAAMAREWAGRLDGTGLPIWLTEADVAGQRLTRVRAGAVDSQEDAQLLAQRLTRDFGLDTWITTVPEGESIPADAIITTLRYLFPH